MANEAKISNGQFFIVITLSRIMHVMLYKADNFTSGAPLMLGLLISTAFEALLAVPVFVFLAKKDEITAVAFANKKTGFALKAAIAVYFVFVSSVTLYLFADFMHTEFEHVATPAWIVAILALAGAYCAKMGIEGIARAGTAVFWVFLALLAVLALVNEGRYDPLNLVPIRRSDYSATWEYVIKDISSCRWLPLAVALFENLKRGAQKAAVGYLATKLLLIEGVLALITMVLWTFVEVPGYPILALGVYAKTEIIRQFNAVNMFVWVLNCVLVNGVYLYVASGVAKKRTWLSVAVPAGLSATLAMLYYKQVISLSPNDRSALMLAGIVLIGVLVPIAAIICWRVKKYAKNRCACAVRDDAV